jgi:hypothetical protein
LIPQGNKQRKIMREDEMEDLVGTVSQTFLGLTVHCARCHDHKFDPVSQKEYYQLSSALAGVRRGSRRLPPETDPTPRKRRIERLEDNINKMEHQVRSMVHRERTGQPTVQPQPPAPIARWTFDVDLKDSIGTLHGEAKGSARIEDGALVLNGKDAYVETVPLTIALAEKTLEVWVRLDTTDQRGGAAFTVQTLKGDKFDAIVFGENEPNEKLRGSRGKTWLQ